MTRLYSTQGGVRLSRLRPWRTTDPSRVWIHNNAYFSQVPGFGWRFTDDRRFSKLDENVGECALDMSSIKLENSVVARFTRDENGPSIIWTKLPESI